MKKRILTMFITIFAVTSLSGCVTNSELDSLQKENSELIAKNEELNDEISGISETLQAIIDELNDQKDIVSTLVNSINTLLTNIEQNEELIKTKLDSLIAIVEALEAANVENQEVISSMLQTINELKMTITRLSLENYLARNDFSDAYQSFFAKKTIGFVNAGYNDLEVISLFESNYLISNVVAENDNLSTTATITLSEPSAKEYNYVDSYIYYHDELLFNTRSYESADFKFVFNAPNYGKYILKTLTHYDNLVIEKELEFGVTSDHYNFAILNGTLPVLLFAAEHMAINNPDYPTFIALQRPTTYKWDFLPSHTHRLPDFINNPFGTGYNGAFMLGEWIHELYEIDSNSTFELNIVDNYVGIALVAFERFEIPIQNYTVNIWTDGTFTMGVLNKYKTMANLNTYLSQLNSARNNVKNLTFENMNYSVVSGNHHNHALAYAHSNANVNYYVTTLQGLQTTDQAVLDVISNAITVKTVSLLFNNLRASENMTEFEYLLGTRWGEAEDQGLGYYFNSPKDKYILILGTSTAGETPNATNKYYTFDEYIYQIMNKYGSEYEIFYKGHPSYPSSTQRKAMFAENNIVELNNSIPVEIMMYIYPNVYVGGYRGSSFLSSMPGQTLFFFGTEAFVKTQATLKDMIENTDVFDNTEYLFNGSI